MQIEKEDILNNYKESAQEVEMHSHTLDQVTAENKSLFEKVTSVEKSLTLQQTKREELEKKEQNYI